MLLNKKSGWLIIIVILIIGLLRFINLGSFNLQEWDEALYAVRAKSIIYYGDIIDQTNHSVGGLYSATHPPLFIWLTAITYTFFGITEFSSRFISAVSGVGILFLLYYLGKLVYNEKTGLLSVFVLGLNPFFLFWTRQGQFDVLLLFFLLLAIFVYIYRLKKYDFPEFHAKKLHFDILCGIAIGLALLTKLFVAFFILFGIIIFEFFKKENKEYKNILIITLIAFFIAFPWHLYMIVIHGNGNILFFLNQSALYERTFSGIEGNTKDLGLFFYINQIIIYFPYLIVFAIYGIFNSIKSKINVEKPLLLFFITYFIIISVIATKLSVYILPLSVFIAIWGSKIIVDIISLKLSRKTSFLLLTLSNLFIIWSIDIAFRNSIKQLFSSNILSSLQSLCSTHYLLFILLIILELLIIFFLSYSSLQKFFSILIYLFIVFPVLMLSIYNIFILDREKYNDGIIQISEFIKENPPEMIFSIGDGPNPEISYYLNGIDIGWNNNIKFIRLEPKIGLKNVYNALDTLKNINAYIILEKEEILLEKFKNASQVIPDNFSIIYETQGFSLFKLRRDNIKSLN